MTRRRRHVLIVGPSSVLGNWQRELQTWGAFRVAVYHGANRKLALDGVLQGRTEVLITSYATYRWEPLCCPSTARTGADLAQGSSAGQDAVWGGCQCALAVHAMQLQQAEIVCFKPHAKPVVRRLHMKDLSQVSWHVAIFDEAHELKEGTKKWEAALSLNTKRRYGLTGTAMQVCHSWPQSPCVATGRLSVCPRLAQQARGELFRQHMQQGRHCAGFVVRSDSFKQLRVRSAGLSQNEHKELWALLHWANPELIKDWPGFNSHYVKALKMGQKQDATAEQLRKVLCGSHHGSVPQCMQNTAHHTFVQVERVVRSPNQHRIE